MAELVFKDCYVRIGSSAGGGAATAISTAVTGVTITYSAETLDKTAMTNDGRARLPGLKDWSITLDFNQDFASTSIEKYYWNAIGTTDSWISVRPTTANEAASNPSYNGNGLIESFTPIAGTVGDKAAFSVTYMGADGRALQRVVAGT